MGLIVKEIISTLCRSCKFGISHLLLVATTLALFGLLSSCGGGSSDPTTNSSTATSTGYYGQVVKGLVADATVNAYLLSANGMRTLLGSEKTNAKGEYSFPTNANVNALIMLEAVGGTYTDEATLSQTKLDIPLRAVFQSSGKSQKITISPFTEIATREMERLGSSTWSNTNVSIANKHVSDFIGASSLFDVKFYELSSSQDYTSMLPSDLIFSLYVGATSFFIQRTPAVPGVNQLDSALTALQRLATIDPFDDVAGPRLIRSLLSQIEISTLSSGDKEALKSSLLLLQTNAPTTQVNAAVPSDTASGSANVIPANDQWEMIAAPNTAVTSPLSTLFNFRGALVAYGQPTAGSRHISNYSASTGELYADSHATIGRWHGGVLIDATRVANSITPIQNSAIVVPQADGRHYALARKPDSSPTCGIQKLSLVAATKPSTNGLAILSSNPVLSTISSVSADSSAALYYAGNRIFVAYDIGLTRGDGSVSRITTMGGVTAPWLSEIATDTQFRTTNSSSPYVSTMVTGKTSDKLVALVTDASSGPQSQFAAVFDASGLTVDTSLCSTAARLPGANISPASSAIENYIFTGSGSIFGGSASNSLFRGAPISVSFGTRGELASALGLVLNPGTKVFELAGDRYAQIGVIEGGYTLAGQSSKNSLPYVAVDPNVIVPTSGVRKYALLQSTSLITVTDPAFGSVQFPDGKIKSINLEINFNEFPIGTISPYYGTATCTIEIMLGSQSFVISSQDRTLQGSTPWYGPCTGAVTGPNGDTAAVWINAIVGNKLVYGAALLQKR